MNPSNISAHNSSRTSPHEDAILAEQTSQLYDTYKTAAIASLINAPILVFIMWPIIGHDILFIWLAAIILLTLARSILAYKYSVMAPPVEKARLWYRRFFVGSILASLLWGASSIVMISTDNVAHQVFLAFVLGGMAAGAVTNLTHMKALFYSYIGLTLIPLIIQFFYHDGELGFEMGTMLILYFTMLVVAGKRVHNNIIQNIRLNIEGLEREQSLQQSEHRYRTLLETATDGFFLHDLQGNFLDVNQETCRRLGYTHDQMLKMSISEIVVGGTAESLKDTYLKLKENRTIQIERNFRRKDGTTFPAEVSLGLIQLGSEEFFSVLSRDVTDRKKIEAGLIAAKKEAESANAAKSEFLSNMSHELRTPMNAILGFAQMLDLDAHDFTATQKGNITEILDAGQHLLFLINEILDLAKIETGKLSVSMENVHLDDILQQSIPLIDVSAKARQLEILDNITGKGHAVRADFTRLKQVMVNILSNAVKYNKINGTITLEAKLTDDQRLRIYVIDTGKGLSPDEITQLFTPFTRLDKTNNVEGTGIGLVITKQLVELMGGTIGVESTLGEGCRFWVEFEFTQNT
ncbi:sensor histidine kinase [Paremcibacter congregatus]|uniref:histidine kinase n=1 Tax=Paremcibacter congregatus TaxID=2043170 RepID=A0A2G4YY55_9PROT|nr:PAS domain S-box protein [Paremcibacter congregatus]PHZ86376.1 hypothetical protein CRD36_02110 [Paremcibacter congregatus]QDE27979.1 PAS domain S-box protein [Paremcibacter congregatus]